MDRNATTWALVFSTHAVDDRRGKLTVGVCLEQADPGAASVPCGQAHVAEVYAVVAAPYRRFPGAAPLADFAGGACLAPFGGYLGIAYERTLLDYRWLLPASGEWNAGVRTIACLLVPVPGATVAGSMRGSELVFTDHFASSDQWPKDPDANARCAAQYPGDGTLSVTKPAHAQGLAGVLEKTQASLLCVASPKACPPTWPGTCG